MVKNAQRGQRHNIVSYWDHDVDKSTSYMANMKGIQIHDPKVKARIVDLEHTSLAAAAAIPDVTTMHN